MRDEDDYEYWRNRAQELERHIRRIHATWCVYNSSRSVMDRHLLSDAIHDAYDEVAR
jgi:hypothetical protein